MFAFTPSSSLFLRTPQLSHSSLCGTKLNTTISPIRANVSMQGASPSVPFLPNPENLSADLPGYAGFDPLGFSNLFNVKFLMEAEIKHARVCMLACVGLLVQEQFTFGFYSGAPKLAHATHDWAVAQGSMMQLLFWICMFEVVVGVPAVVQMLTLDSPRKPGEFAFDPLGLGKNPETYKRFEVSEIKNGRLAMIAIGGLLHQQFVTDMTPVQQLLSGKFMP